MTLRASKALREASEVIADSPAALQLRYLQTLGSIAAEKNSTIVFPVSGGSHQPCPHCLSLSPSLSLLFTHSLTPLISLTGSSGVLSIHSHDFALT